ncbi:FkbM family methyltransferase [Enterocloster sp. OA13]|uniref:FkbM family methyltransferase n=1 Tax=Enterocloster sp. OA13 TaxID=2914161 RepID=UPI001F054F73|nr:FkbM family methyltransferase [Enterocloster sp. OA13]
MDVRRCFPCDEKVDNKSFESRIERIYHALLDEKSQYIFSCRMMYSLTKDYKYISKILAKTDAGRQFSEKLDSVINEVGFFNGTGIDWCGSGEFGDCLVGDGQGALIYGAGIKGTRLVQLFPEKNWKGYIDRYRRGILNGLPILGINECNNLSDKSIVISNTMNPYDIKNDLVNEGVSEKNIIILREYDSIAGQNIYFDDAILRNVKEIKGAFIDVGCYDGADTINYFKRTGNINAPVIAIEADATNYNICKKILQAYKNVSVINVGLSDKKEVKKFNQISTSNSKFSESGNVEVKTVPLDTIVEKQSVGFIKMDIEGYEERALRGAMKTIIEQHPILAISIYHKRSDIWKLPELLLEMNPGYRFYLRHYTVGVTDTVIYAIDKRNLIV